MNWPRNDATSSRVKMRFSFTCALADFGHIDASANTWTGGSGERICWKLEISPHCSWRPSPHMAWR